MVVILSVKQFNVDYSAPVCIASHRWSTANTVPSTGSRWVPWLQSLVIGLVLKHQQLDKQQLDHIRNILKAKKYVFLVL